MSAPVSRDPLVVNTQDGMTWVRRAVTREGRGLYALAGSVAGVPDVVLASLADLAEHGLASMADALPMPVGPVPRSAETELEGARLSLWETEQENERLRLRVDEVERKYTFDTAELKRQLDTARVDGQRLIRAEQRRAELEAVLETHRKDDRAELERWRARVAELEAAERYRAETLRRSRADFAEQAQKETDPERRSLLRSLAGGTPEDPHDSPLHHDWRLGRDLPETGGAQ